MAEYPEWVLKHKTKGAYINKVGDKYYLYAAHSERIKGTNKVRRVSDGYLGRITEQDGLIQSREKVKDAVISYEFGLSFAILSCADKIHAGLRKSFVKYGDLIYVCSILQYIYGFHSLALFRLSYLQFHFQELFYPDSFTDAQLVGIERGVRMLTDTLAKHFGADLIHSKAYCSTVNLISINKKLYCSNISEELLSLSAKYSISWEEALWPR